MRHRLVNTCLLVAGIAASATIASAQEEVKTGRLYEAGIDGGIAFGVSKPTSTTIGIPAQTMRFGIFINRRWSIEPAFGIQSESGSGSRVTRYNLTLGTLYHITKRPARVGVGWYARPFLGMTGIDTNNSSNDTRALMGIGGGYKIRLTDRFAGRFEGNYQYLFSAGDEGSQNQLGITFGLSFFTR